MDRLWRRLLTVMAFAVCVGVPTSARAGDSDDHDDGRHEHLGAATIAARQRYFGIENVDPRTGHVRDDRVILSWTGVSNFAASMNGHVFMMDAYLARDGGARVNGAVIGHWPSITYVNSTQEELAALKPEVLLIGHTHFDHNGDLPYLVRAIPGLRVYGTAEHCNDLRDEVRDAKVNCTSIFEVGAALGTVWEPKHEIIPGVRIIAVKHPHSSATPDPVNDPPFGWTPAPCNSFQQYPVEADEPLAWGAPLVGPPSGPIAIMWHFTVARSGRFSVACTSAAAASSAAGLLGGSTSVDTLTSGPLRRLAPIQNSVALNQRAWQRFGLVVVSSRDDRTVTYRVAAAAKPHVG